MFTFQNCKLPIIIISVQFGSVLLCSGELNVSLVELPSAVFDELVSYMAVVQADNYISVLNILLCGRTV